MAFNPYLIVYFQLKRTRKYGVTVSDNSFESSEFQEDFLYQRLFQFDSINFLYCRKVVGYFSIPVYYYKNRVVNDIVTLIRRKVCNKIYSDFFLRIYRD